MQERKKEKIKIINQHICKTIETKVVIKSFLKETTKDLMKVKQKNQKVLPSDELQKVKLRFTF